MGKLSLSCPFCCDEKFTSHNTLKYHILSMVDNLMCPACNYRCDSIIDLTEHLGRECKEKEIEPSPPVEQIPQINIKKEANFEHQVSGDEVNKSNAVVNAKVKIEDNREDKSILAEALSRTEDDLPNEGYEENSTKVIYMCEMCNINFTSVEEHLQKYHEGEEVVYESEDTAHLNDGNEEDGGAEENMFESNEEEEPDNPVEYIEDTRSSNTIEEQQCLDKDGRVYTRKVVKIGKFWEDKNNQEEQDGPMTEKYLLENGKIRKITEEEAEAVEDKESIIQIHQCSKCYLQFPNMDHYYKHKCDPSKIKNKYKCTHCTAVFLNYQSLTGHMKSHLTKDESTGKIKRVVTLGPYTCDVCNTMFPSFKSLRLHKRMHEPIKDKIPEAPVSYSITGPIDESREVVRHMFICSICNKTYDKEYEEVHMTSHSQQDNFNCTVCNRKFFTKENLEMHVKAHSNGKKFTCSYCKKPFTTYNALQEHVTNQCQKRQYECQYCGRRFSRPHEKVKHERIHTGEKPHVCQICGKAFRVSYCLTLHLRTHSGTRPYHCTTCGKRFKSHSVYNHHLLTHSDVRAYKCPYCPKAFKTSVQLAGHKNSHIKPFACTECNRPFASLYAVRAHMETHKRDNNLKIDCWLCGATYARAFALRDHMKTQHAGANINMDENVLIEYETNESTNQIENEMRTETEEEQMEEAEEQMEAEEETATA